MVAASHPDAETEAWSLRACLVDKLVDLHRSRPLEVELASTTILPAVYVRTRVFAHDNLIHQLCNNTRLCANHVEELVGVPKNGSCSMRQAMTFLTSMTAMPNSFSNWISVATLTSMTSFSGSGSELTSLVIGRTAVAGIFELSPCRHPRCQVPWK